jgi:hypothetical protein
MSDQRKGHDDKLDATIEDSFPASDPPPTTPEGGTKKSKELRDSQSAAGENLPKGGPTSDRHAAETTAARQEGVHPAETDKR